MTGPTPDRLCATCGTAWPVGPLQPRSCPGRCGSLADPVPAAQTCPRRIETPGPWKYSQGPDTWDNRGGLSGQGPVGVSCSYCGSLHPDRFMDLVRAGWIVGPTDKAYKAYLARPVTAAGLAAKKTRWLETATAKAIRDLGARDGKTPEQVDADLGQHWVEIEGPLHASGSQEAKFYFQHLTSEQRDEFIALHNDGTMRVGYPGRFYRAPFFARPGAPSVDAAP